MSQPNIDTPGSLAASSEPAPPGGLGGLVPARQQPGKDTTAPAADFAPASPTPPPAPAATADPVREGQAHVAERRQMPDGPPDTFLVGVYLLPAVIQAASRRSRRVDNYQLAVEAIDALRAELPDLVARRHAGPAQREDSLFPPRQGASTTAAAARDGRRRLWSFQATEADTNVIDDMVDATGARSRSELISCAPEAHLLTVSD
ncbi:hypothetical protein ACFYUV_51035 [Nonomuraea sp. NPDC003560]|uniref:hypothetical protein n=1 Tax=Nonomuraea sp. NPDC003560 TaxID=3364341 RepID=UPI00367F9354